jgi:hypothetical protein
VGLATGTSRDDRPAIARGDPLAETSGDGTGLAAQAGEAEGSLTLGDGVPRGLRVYTGPRTLIGPSAMGDLGRPRFSLKVLHHHPGRLPWPRAARSAPPASRG